MAASTDTVTVGPITGWILGWWLGRLKRIDYDVIGSWVGSEARQPSSTRTVASMTLGTWMNVLQWVKGRRAAKGLSLIGAPTMNAPDAAGMT